MALARSAAARARAAGLLAWWLGELRELLPPTLARVGPRRHTLLLQLERPFVRVYERRGRRLESLGSLVLPESRPARRRRRRARAAAAPGARAATRDATVLVLGEDDALTCTDVLPASAEGDLARIMAHKLDLLTPWSAEQGYAAQKVLGRRRDGMLEVLLAAASRAAPGRAAAPARRAGRDAGGGRRGPGSGPAGAPPGSISCAQAHPQRRGRLAWLILLVLGSLALLAGAAAGRAGRSTSGSSCWRSRRS